MLSDPVDSNYVLEDLEQLALAKNYTAWQQRLVSREVGKRVVDIGCGLGNLIGGLLDRELVIALDPDPELVARVDRRFMGRNNLHTLICDVTDECFSALARFHPDSCISTNVLEHIEDDVRALRAMRSILVPGGVVVLLVPAFEALYGPIDEKLGHYRRYTRASLAQVARAAGLRIRKAHYLNIVGFFGWWANARVFGVRPTRSGKSPSSTGMSRPRCRGSRMPCIPPSDSRCSRCWSEPAGLIQALAQPARRVLRHHRIDVIAGGPFEARDARDARQQLQVPVVVVERRSRNGAVCRINCKLADRAPGPGHA